MTNISYAPSLPRLIANFFEARSRVYAARRATAITRNLILNGLQHWWYLYCESGATLAQKTTPVFVM